MTPLQMPRTAKGEVVTIELSVIYTP